MTKTILAVLAHPDDETFGLGGTIALYAQKGYEVYYVCATRGEAGIAEAEFLKGYENAAEMRTAELMRAAKILGLKDVFFLGYRDSGMPGTEENRHPNAQINHSIDEVAGKVVKYIRDNGRPRLPLKMRMMRLSTRKLGRRLNRGRFTITFSRVGFSNGQRA